MEHYDFLNGDKDFTYNLGEMGPFLYNGEHDENSSNSLSSFEIKQLDFSHNDEVYIYSNKNIKIVEDRSPSNDKNKENENNNKNSTAENSNEKEKEKEISKVPEKTNHKKEVKSEKKPIFQEKDIASSKSLEWRYDNAKKHWKVKTSQDFTQCINKSIKNSDLPKYLKNPISKPDSLLFTANVTESDNYFFLEQDLRTILTFGKGETKKISNNYDKISKIYKFFEKIGYNNLSVKMLEIKNLFEMKYEDYIKKFYESDEFENFKNEENTIFYDEGTKKKEGFTISEDYGLIKILGGKRKRD
jgi:hypothetical protein